MADTREGLGEMIVRGVAQGVRAGGATQTCGEGRGGEGRGGEGRGGEGEGEGRGGEGEGRGGGGEGRGGGGEGRGRGGRGEGRGGGGEGEGRGRGGGVIPMSVAESPLLERQREEGGRQELQVFFLTWTGSSSRELCYQ